MSAIVLKKLTSFDYAVGIGYVEVWVNPGTLAYVQPRRRQDTLDGTLLYFNVDGGLLAVREDVDEVLAILAGRDYDREQKLLGELADDELAADAAYRDMLQHPETVVDAPELFS